MKRNKHRLYVTLHARSGAARMPGGEDVCHWALLIGPKHELPDARGTLFDVKEKLTSTGTWEWVFEEKDVGLGAANMILVRVLVGKVEDVAQAGQVLRTTPRRSDTLGWNCVGWVHEALQRLQADPTVGLAGAADWQQIRDAAMAYLQRKKDEHRFDGRRKFDTLRVPTFDMLGNAETIP